MDHAITSDDWSDLRQFRSMPDIDIDRLHAYRTRRLRAEIEEADIGLLILSNPLSMRYAYDYEGYALFQAHIPETYVFHPLDGPTVMHGVSGPRPTMIDDVRPNRPLTFFDTGPAQHEASNLLADDVVAFLAEIGCTNQRVAIEYLNPSLTLALQRRGLEVVDGIPIAQAARVIKSDDEIACMRWAIAVAEHGMRKMHDVLRPGVTETQLWGLLNYTNLANAGSWHDGRMLASGPRTNPWLQEASQRPVESGDLVAFDTDMMGPKGYYADISRTFHCGPAKPTTRQKQVYQLAHDEVHHNVELVPAPELLRRCSSSRCYRSSSGAVAAPMHRHAAPAHSYTRDRRSAQRGVFPNARNGRGRKRRFERRRGGRDVNVDSALYRAVDDRSWRAAGQSAGDHPQGRRRTRGRTRARAGSTRDHQARTTVGGPSARARHAH